MKVCGIIAEYNPFHSGHAYHIAAARRESGCDYIIAVMSGDFVQRGAPALIDKYIRARQALLEGADLVLMLPVYASTASAEGFARAGIAALMTTGVVDSVSFGCEDTSVCSGHYQNLARKLAWESESFQAALVEKLASGKSYASARSDVIKSFEAGSIDTSLLQKPNNLLAFEYLRAMERSGCGMDIYPVKRIGSYHNASIPNLTTDSVSEAAAETMLKTMPKAAPETTLETTPKAALETTLETMLEAASGTSPVFASASACRQTLLSDSREKLWQLESAGQIPPAVCRLLADYANQYDYLAEDDFSRMLHYALLLHRTEGYRRFYNCGGDLSARIAGKLPEYESFTQFCDVLKNKSVTRTRIARVLTHILLGLPAQMPAPLLRHDRLPYLRVLGLKKSAAPLLHELKQRSAAPLITRPARAKRKLTPDAMDYFAQDLFAADVYRSALFHKCGRCCADDYRRTINTI